MFCFLWTGTIFDLFQLSGKIQEFKELQNITDNGFILLESQIFIIPIDMLPWPWALLMSTAQMIFKISWSSKSTPKIVASHKQFVSVGTGLSFSIGVHCLAKCKLKKLAFCWKSIMSWSFIMSSGIKGIFLPLWKVFRIVQCVFALVARLFKLGLNWKLYSFFLFVI